MEEEYQHVAPFLPFEREIYEKVKEKLSESGKEDILLKLEDFPEGLLARFVRGSSHIKKEEKMIKRIMNYLIKTVEFRTNNNMETICIQGLSNLETFRDYFWSGKLIYKTNEYNFNNLSEIEKENDKENLVDYSYKIYRPVILIDLSEINLKNVKKMEEKDLIKYSVFAEELCSLKLKYKWKCCSKLLVVYDLTGMTLSDYYKIYKCGLPKILELLEANYPESIDKIFILHPPSMFSWCFKMLTAFLDKETINNVKFLKTNEEINKTFELEGIDISKLPKKNFIGGTDDCVIDPIISDDVIKLFNQAKGNHVSLETLTNLISS